MTTNANLLPGTLIEYKTVGGTPATAWVMHHVGGLTDKTIGLRVTGESDELNKDCNRGVEFTLYVKPRGRAKIIQLPENAPTEKFVPKHLRAEQRVARDHAPRTGSSHADCTHESSKSARAKCRKDRAIALKAGDAVEAAAN